MIRLRQITIQAFRGIPEKLELDLSAPLTVIYAANGSGKTTICDAAEWLLTGTIRRLQGLASDGPEIRCKFSPDSAATMVSATLEVDDSVIAIERRLNRCRWRVADGPWEQVGQTALLQKLAPSAVQPGVHLAHANPSRQIWLRGTRFLSGEALSTLLSSGAESLGERQRVFSDLLGVGHLLETERQLDSYVSEIGPYLRRQELALAEKDSEIEIQEENTALADGANNRLAAATELLNRARRNLEPGARDQIHGGEAAARNAARILRTALVGQKQDFEQKRQAQLRLPGNWPHRRALSQAQQEDKDRLTALAAEEDNNRTLISQSEPNLQLATADVTRHSTAIERLDERERELKQAQAKATLPLQEYLRAHGLLSLNISNAFAMVDGEVSGRARIARIDLLRSMLTDLPRIAAQREQLVARKRDYEEASRLAPSADSTTATRRSMEHERERLAGLRAQYEQATGPLDQLRHYARTVADAFGHNETKCPVCAHDWKSTDALKNALLSAEGATPAAVLALDQQLRAAEARQQALQGQLLRDNQLLVRAVETERALRETESTINAFATRIAQVGFVLDDPQLKLSIERMIARLNLVAELRVLREELRATQKIGAPELPSNSSVAEVHARILPFFVSTRAAAQEALTEAEARTELATAAMAEAAESGRRIESERALIDNRLNQRGARLQALQSAWRVLAGDRDWSDEALEEITAQLRLLEERLTATERALAQAESLLQELAAAGQLSRLRAQRRQLAAERDRLQKYHNAAAAIRDSYAVSRRDHVRQQLAEFVRVISALFTRMQCNLVYDDIAAGENDSPLSWRAIADAYRLDPEVTFSQGQRQDFALSIFLARARGLGGTFVLDEPVAHLDDLNRVALIDVFRAIVLEATPGLAFVITTANKSLVRHILEKFSRVRGTGLAVADPALSVVTISGNPRAGVTVSQRAPN